MEIKQKYEELFEKLADMEVEELAQFFNCSPNDILLDDITDESEFNSVPYKVICGDIELSDRALVEDFGNIEAVLGSINIGRYPSLESDITSLGKLKYVYGDLRAGFSQLCDLGNLLAVGGYVDLESADLKSTGSLEYVGEDLIIRDNSDLKDASSLKYIGKNLDSQDTRISSFDNLAYVGGSIDKDEDTVIDASIINHGKIR